MRQSHPSNALAAADDLLSAKWNIPILRVLAQGPTRFSGISIAIPAISAKILADRLRHLEAASIISKITLPPPADCQVYTLTEIGETTRPILEAIRQWAPLYNSKVSGNTLADPETTPVSDIKLTRKTTSFIGNK